MSKRVLLAGLYHETNTFLKGHTPLSEFHLLRGEEMLGIRDDVSPLAGVLEVAAEMGWEVIPVVDLRAMPSASVDDDVVDLFWQAFEETAVREREHGIDGIYLVLHGAMVSASLPDVEGVLLQRISRLNEYADVPICGVLDLHANFTSLMARFSNGLLAYQKNPHTDAKQTATRSALLLDQLMTTGIRPVTVWDHPPLMWPPTGTGTDSDPMLTLEVYAREIEATHPEILAVNVFGGFSFADIPETGLSFSAVTIGSPEVAQEKLRQLSMLALSLKRLGKFTGMPMQQALERTASHRRGPILLVEPADNIGAGAPGDITIVLRALVEGGVQNAGFVLNDPENVRLLWDRAPGQWLRLAVGGNSGEIGAEPLPLDVELLSRSDGRFTLEDPQSHLASMSGREIDMGPCVVVRHQGICILLTSRKTPPFDLGQWRSQHIQPEELGVIGIKAAVAHRRAYAPIAVASYTLDTPGPCAENLRLLPYKKVTRPIYPLDE